MGITSTVGGHRSKRNRNVDAVGVSVSATANGSMGPQNTVRVDDPTFVEPNVLMEATGF